MNNFKIALFCTIISVTFGTSIAQGAPNNQPMMEVIGPTLSTDSQSILTCKREAGTETCLTLKTPMELGKVLGIVKIVALKNSTSSWLAVTNKSVAVCGMKFSTKQIVCYPVVGFSENLQGIQQAPRGRISDLFDQAKPAFAAAAKHVTIALSPQRIEAIKGIYALSSVDQESNCADHWCSDDMPRIEVPGTREGGGDGEIGNMPVIEVPGVSEGAEIGGSGGRIPPGSAPNESPARAACTSSAYIAFKTMALVCSLEKSFSAKKECDDYNWREYLISLEMCRGIP